MRILLFLLAWIASAAWEIATIYSSHTPAEVVSDFETDLAVALSALNWTYGLSCASLSITVESSVDWLFVRPPALLLDASFDRSIGSQVHMKAQELSIPVLSLSLQVSNMAASANPSVHPSVQSLLVAVSALVAKYEWTALSVITDTSEVGMRIAQHFGEESNNMAEVYSLPSDGGLEVVDSLLGKEVKTRSSPVILCTAGKFICGHVITAAFAHNMLREGFEFILTEPQELVETPGVPANQTIGLLYLIERGVHGAKTASQLHAFRTAQWILRLSAISDAQDAISLTLFPSEDLHEFEIWNRKEKGTELVGVAGRAVTIFSQVFFPGNTTTAPVIKRPMVELSIDRDLTNPTTPPNTPYGDYFLAASLAFQEIRDRNDILPTHDLVWRNVTYGATEFAEPYVTERLKSNREKLGVAHMGPIGSAVALGAMNVMRKMGITLPVIGAVNSAVALKNSTVNPFYVRTIVSNGFGATVYMTMFRYFGWKKINILYGNETFGKDFYANALRIATEYGIEIANREDLRMIDPAVNNNTIWNHRAQLEEIIRTNVRPLLCGLLLPTPSYVFQALYDLGARAGEIVYFGDLSTSLFAGLPPANASKALEIGLGGIQLTAATYVTSVGESAFHHFLKVYGHNPIANSCFYYDSAYALAYTLKFLIRKGMNYEDPNVFMKTLREMQFRGCSGVVAFEPGTNDRSFPGYVVVNIQGNASNLQLIQTGLYTPTSVKIFDFKTPIVWPGNVTHSPTADIVNSIDCPFKERNLHDFHEGKTLATILSLLIAALISVLSFVIYLKFWRRQIPPLVEPCQISVDDVLLMTSIVLEAFQYAALGPNFKVISSVLFTLGEALSVSLSDLVTFSNGVFWTCLDVVLATCALWVALVVFVFFRLDDRCRNVLFIGNIGWISWLVLPYLGNLCFLPIVSILLDVIVCDQGVGDTADSISYTDSILSRDCYVKCWQGTHVYYVMFSIAGLVLYAPLAVLLRPLWQEFQSELHIKTAPIHFLVKTIFQILIISLSKSLKRTNVLAHGVIFLLLLVLYFLFEYKSDRFNYGRIAHWHRMSLFAVFWLSLLTLISDFHSLSPVFWMLITVIGWLVIATFGVCVMLRKYPSLLFRAKGVDTQKLFRFAFTFHNSAGNIKVVEGLNKRRMSSVSIESQIPRTKQSEFAET